MLAGIAAVFAITLIAGFVAYIGDRVGHQVGRRRLTLFGLRPKYTSTIVAVGTGMLIALTVTVVALVASQYVRAAFFQLGSLNSQISTLQAQETALQLDNKTAREGDLVIPIGQAISGVTIFLSRQQTDAEQMRLISGFFDQTVRLGNENWTRAGLKPFTQKSSDPAIAAKLRQELAIVAQKNGQAPVMLMAVADTNLFRGEELHFALEQWIDIRLARRGEVLASIDVTGGQPANLQIASLAALREMARRGMPAPFLSVPYGNLEQAKALQTKLLHGKGHYRVQVKAAADTYPRTGGVALEFSLVRATSNMPILGLDPGTRKCGFAVVEAAGVPPLALGIAPLDQLAATLERLLATYPAIDLVAIGKGTNAATVVRAVEAAGRAYALVDERETTLRARGRFFRDHPPRGWRRLVPKGMLLPDRPIDDYAALLIAERYLSAAN